MSTSPISKTQKLRKKVHPVVFYTHIFFHKNLGTVSLFFDFDKNMSTYPISKFQKLRKKIIHFLLFSVKNSKKCKKYNLFFHKNLGTVSLFSDFCKNLCTSPTLYIYYFFIFIQIFLKNRQFIFS